MRVAAVASALLACTPAAAQSPAPACDLRGEVIQWIADYCMLRMQTDDEIAVAGCIAEHRRTTSPDECTAKRNWKRALCGLYAAGEGSKAVERCVRDPEFMGRTVRRRGVGG